MELPQLPNFQPAQPFTIGPTGVVTFLQTPSLPGGTIPTIAAGVNGNVPKFSGIAGQLIDSLLAAPASAFVGLSDAQVLTNKTIAGASNTLSVRIANDVTGLAANVATFLGAPSSANFLAALTSSTGTGVNVFATSPAIATPNITGLGRTSSQPGGPAGTLSTVGVMMGLAGTVTPTGSGNVLIIVSGDGFNNTAGDSLTVTLRTGTGGAPVNGAALTGTARSVAKNLGTQPTGGNMSMPFTLVAYVTGLALATAVWIDVAVAAVIGGTATIRDIDIQAVEL